MQYSVEELGTLKKKISVTVSAADVDTKILSVANSYRSNVAIQGFRKGKAPLSVIERRFSKDILNEVTRDLVEDGVRQSSLELKLEPASRLAFDTPELKKEEDFVFSYTLDVMPDFDLPDYQDFPLEEEEVVVTDADVDDIIEKARHDLAELADIDEVRAAVDGEIVSADFDGFDTEGNPYPALTAKGVFVSVGDNQTLPEFEELVKSLKVGEEGEKEITFPEDFQNFDIAGKTFKIKAKVLGLKSRVLPEVTDEFATKLGKFENLEAARDAIRTAVTNSRKNVAKSYAQKKLLDALLEKVDFPLPESLVARFAQLSEIEMLETLHREGKLNEDNLNMEEMHKKAEEHATPQIKAYVFLYKVAKKEEVTVLEADLLNEIHSIAMRSNRSFNEVRDEYVNNDMIAGLQEKIQSAKTLELLYSKAKIEYVKAAEQASN